MRHASMIYGNVRLPIVKDAPADGKTYGRKDKAWTEITGDYNWKLHSPEEIIGDLDEPANIVATIDGTGAVDETIPAGTYAITAMNEAGETLPVNVPEMVILVDTTSVVVTWDAVTGATGYRVYNVATGDYFELATESWNYLTQTPATAGTLPVANTAYIYQSPFTIASGDTVEVTGENAAIVTSVDPLDPTKKQIHIVVTPGLDGLSAYEIAVANGFVGTEAEWLASLVGDDGAPGADGTDGHTPYIQSGYWYINGVNTGIPATGPQGIPGAPGSPGRGIASITLISTVGLVKTYRITYTDATTFDYDVTDGEDGTGGTGSDAPELHLDFEEAGDEFVYNVPYAMKFTSMSCEGTDATLDIALNTNLARYDKLTITATAAGLVSLYGEYV